MKNDNVQIYQVNNDGTVFVNNDFIYDTMRIPWIAKNEIREFSKKGMKIIFTDFLKK